jgi:hypothetical protein
MTSLQPPAVFRRGFFLCEPMKARKSAKRGRRPNRAELSTCGANVRALAARSGLTQRAIWSIEGETNRPRKAIESQDFAGNERQKNPDPGSSSAGVFFTAAAPCLNAESKENCRGLANALMVRAGRAVLGWSQTKLGDRAGVTQRTTHLIESAATAARRGMQGGVGNDANDP